MIWCVSFRLALTIRLPRSATAPPFARRWWHELITNDRCRALELMLTELRLPAMKVMWTSLS
jgi:hypothetical protein